VVAGLNIANVISGDLNETTNIDRGVVFEVIEIASGRVKANLGPEIPLTGAFYVISSRYITHLLWEKVDFV